eukprot:GILK01005683.1.p1 GENE.GILK01005683.1~~GILK01005683.1.p1  ORF type:complete len:1065 (-),score=74.19 GILK01005683.1:89-3283(-)
MAVCLWRSSLCLSLLLIVCTMQWTSAVQFSRAKRLHHTSRADSHVDAHSRGFFSRCGFWYNNYTTGRGPSSRSGAALFAIDNTTVLMHGGCKDVDCADTDVYSLNMISNQWSKFPIVGKLNPTAGQYRTYSYVPFSTFPNTSRAMLLSYGGIDSENSQTTNSLFVLNLFVNGTTQGFWSAPPQGGKVPPPRAGASLTLLNRPPKRFMLDAIRVIGGDEIYFFLFGGMSDVGELSDMYLLSLAGLDQRLLTPYWLRVEPAPGSTQVLPRKGHTATVVDSKTLIIFGGAVRAVALNTAQFVDLESFVFSYPTVTGTLPSPREEHSAVAFDRKLFIFGGANFGESEFYNDLHMLDTVTREWTVIRPFMESFSMGGFAAPSERYGPAVTVFDQSRMLVLSGCNALTSSCGSGATVHIHELQNACPADCVAANTLGYALGRCLCKNGWTGRLCGDPTPCPGDCSGHGRCNAGRCECYGLFFTEDCSLSKCPANCNNKGACDFRTGQCKCDVPFGDVDCSGLACANNCNNGGVCDFKTGNCTCAPNRGGTDCSIYCDPERCTLNNRGKCSPEGLCECSVPDFLQERSGEYCEDNFGLNGCYETNKGSLCLVNREKMVLDGAFVTSQGGIERQFQLTAVSYPTRIKTNAKLALVIDDVKRAENLGQVLVELVSRTQITMTFKWEQQQPMPNLDRFESQLVGLRLASPEMSCSNDKFCNGHGVCINNQCQCIRGYKGRSCEHPFDWAPCPADCNNRGKCDRGRCVCYPGYSGMSCESGPVCVADCSPMGVCQEGVCVCQPGWTGDDCQTRVPCEEFCNSQNGFCHEGKCVCRSGWQGSDCNTPGPVIPACPMPTKCSNFGTCVQEICVCDDGFGGIDCSTEMQCVKNELGQACSGRGVCHHGKCYCAPSYGGNNCEKGPICPKECIPPYGNCFEGVCECYEGYSGWNCQSSNCPNRCSGHGRCNEASGFCMCEPNWSGADCSRQLQRFCKNANPSKYHKDAKLPSECQRRSSCEQCTANPLCGWCLSTGCCEEGDDVGPFNSLCETWSSNSCPLRNATMTHDGSHHKKTGGH